MLCRDLFIECQYVVFAFVADRVHLCTRRLLLSILSHSDVLSYVGRYYEFPRARVLDLINVCSLPHCLFFYNKYKYIFKILLKCPFPSFVKRAFAIANHICTKPYIGGSGCC